MDELVCKSTGIATFHDFKTLSTDSTDQAETVRLRKLADGHLSWPSITALLLVVNRL